MRGIFWVAGGAALWGTDTILRLPLAQSLTPIQLVFYEHIILAFVVLPILIRNRRYLPKLTGRAWVAIAMISVLGSVMGTVLFTMALKSGSPTTAVLLQKTQPVFAVLLARGILGERLHPRFLFIVAAAIGGADLISFGSNLLAPFESVDARTSLFAMGAAVCWGSSTVFGRYATFHVPFEVVTSLRILCALPLLSALVLYDGFVLPAASNTVPLIMLALIPGFAGLMLYYKGLRTTPASRATIAELAFPATAAVLNWSVLGVTVSPVQILGLTILFSAIFYLRYQPQN